MWLGLDGEIMLELWIFLGIVILSLTAAWLYRAGGSGDYPFWFRELGIMNTVIAGLIILGIIHWSLILTAGAVYGAQTSYFKKKGTDAKWWNWLFVGLAFSAAVLPVVISNGLWLGFLIRTGIVTCFTVGWSELIGKDTCEERGRGWIQVITLPLLLIGA